MSVTRKQLAPRIYRMGHAREVFAALSNPTVQYWIDKGLLSYGREESWQGQIFKFSLAELVHLGVVAELSTFGLFKKLANAHGWTGPGLRMEAQLQLTKPAEIISYYQEHKYAVGIAVRRYFTGGPSPFRPDKRTKREAVHFAVHFMPLADLNGVFKYWFTGNPLAVGPTHRSMLFVSVAAINAVVRRQFGA